MPEANDTVPRTIVPRTVDSAALLKEVASSTGIAPEMLEGFLLADDDLDSLCDTVLAQFAVPSRKPVSAKG